MSLALLLVLLAPFLVFGEGLLVWRVGAAQGRAGFDFLQNEDLFFFLFGGGSCNFRGEAARNDHNPFFIADEDIAGENGRTRAADWDVDIDRMVDNHAHRRGSGPSEHREWLSSDIRRVAQRTVGDESRCASNPQPGGENVAGGRGPRFTPAIDYQNLARPHHLDCFALWVFLVSVIFDPVKVLPRRDISERDRLTNKMAMLLIERC